MKRFPIIILLIALLPMVAAQNTNDDGQQKNTVQSQYLKEKSTIPYKVSHKTAKHRRIATRKGNKELKKNNYSKAINNYRKAIGADSIYSKAQFNRAIAHGKLKQNDTALAYYNKVCQNSSATAEQRTKAHYNAGNIHLAQALAARDTGGYDAQSLRNAINEYKASLRLDSKNRDAQHNLSLAKQLLRPEQQGGKGGGQDQQNQDKNQQDKQQQQQQKQDQQQQNQDQQQQQQKQQDNKDGKQQEQRRREAEQMLNAMKNNEQQTMKAVRMKEANREKRQGNPNRIEKDW